MCDKQSVSKPNVCLSPNVLKERVLDKVGESQVQMLSVDIYHLKTKLSNYLLLQASARHCGGHCCYILPRSLRSCEVASRDLRGEAQRSLDGAH